MKHLVNKVMTQKVAFMGDKVEVRKLSVGSVKEIQKFVEESGKSEDGQIQLLRDVIRLSVVGAEEITDEEFNNFPLGELTKLSEEIMKVSGLGDNSAGN